MKVLFIYVARIQVDIYTWKGYIAMVLHNVKDTKEDFQQQQKSRRRWMMIQLLLMSMLLFNSDVDKIGHTVYNCSNRFKVFVQEM
jgi:hypothetical protein